MPAVLFVCSANQCRSPLAEVLFREALASAGTAEAWRVESAGTWALPGMPATEYGRLEARRRGLDLSRHHSQPASCDLLAEFDLVLTMEQEHQRELQQACPSQAGKVHRLSEAVGAEFDVADPHGGSQADYRSLGDLLAQLMADGLPRIRELAQGVDPGTSTRP